MSGEPKRAIGEDETKPVIFSFADPHSSKSWWSRWGRERLMDLSSILLCLLAILTIVLVWNIWQSKPRDIVVQLPTVTVTVTPSPTFNPSAKPTK